MLLEILEVALEVLEVLLELLCLFLLVFLGFSLAEGTKIAGFSAIIALDSLLGGQADCGKGPSCMGEGGVLPPSTAPCPKRVKARVQDGVKP